jgi:hypothetical protein
VLRQALAADLPALIAIRDRSGADALSDPALVTEAFLRRLIAGGAVALREVEGIVIGFAAIDGAAIHLLVESARRGGGVGRELLASACTAIRAAGHDAAIVALPPDSIAERHYRVAGWIEAGRSVAGGMVLKKPL